MSINQTDLEKIMDLIADPACICIEHCNQTITPDTKKPMRVVALQYQIYKGLLKAKRYQSIDLPGFKMKDYQAKTFHNFYRMLDMSIKDIIRTIQPMEVYIVFQNE